MLKSRIEGIGTAVPAYRASQVQLAGWAREVAAHQSDVGDRRPGAAIDRIFRGSAIRYRSSVVPDYTTDPNHFVLHAPNWELQPAASTAARMAVYCREAPTLAAHAATACLDAATLEDRGRISHLIIVSCTGFSAPGLDAQLVDILGLRVDIERLTIGFMGCYAAFNAMRTADAICRSNAEACVLIVCVELCSLHFQGEQTMNNIVANSLFADGAGALLVRSAIGNAEGAGFDLLDSLSRLERSADDQMTWTITNTGFQMRLTAEVPATVRRSIGPFIDALLCRNDVPRAAVAFWAIHPGGRRIVEAVQERLELRDDDVAPSFDVLAEYGNMSSPTILFVLDRLRKTGLSPGALGVAMAFGPGLTFEAALLRAV